MKKKIFIFALLLASLAALAGHLHAETPDNPEIFPDIQAEAEISPDNGYSDSYIRYNCAFNAPSCQLVGTTRTGGPAGHSRTNISHNCRLAGHHEILNDGRLAGIPAVHSFQAFISRFPSGKLSEYHHFISLHKLVI